MSQGLQKSAQNKEKLFKNLQRTKKNMAKNAVGLKRNGAKSKHMRKYSKNSSNLQSMNFSRKN